MILDELALKMIAFDGGTPKRIQHFLKVHNFARLIASGEGVDASTTFVIEAAALVHDIGIKICMEKYGNCAGHLQEQEGPALAKAMLTELGFDETVIARVCYLVGHHHTYTDIDGIDYQILVEADFLVNLFENGSDLSSIQNVGETIFKTATGTRILHEMFGF